MPKKNEKIREIPHNLEAEMSVLGCVFFDQDLSLEIVSKVKPEDFYSEANRCIFEAMTNVLHANRPIDFVTVTDELEKNGNMEACGGIAYLTEVARSVPSAVNYKHYVDIVYRDSVLRKLIRASSDIINECAADVTAETAISFAEKLVFDISASSETSKLTPVSDNLTEVMEELEQIAEDSEAFKGMPTRFHALDEILNGLHRSDLVLIAARPAMGKTSFAMNLVENLALDGRVCAVFSLEMPKNQIIRRMLCSIAEVSLADALKGKLSVSDWQKIWTANSKLENANIFIDDSSLNTPYDILSKCRRIKAQHGLDCIMIDYIQLMSGNNKESRQQEISEISRNLKILAKEIDVPVIALSQLSRAVEARVSQRPQLSDLRESGAIEQDADIVMFIHRPDKVESNKDRLAKGEIQKDVVELIIAKHRNGATGSVNLRWIGPYTKFKNFSAQADQIAEAYDTYRPKEREVDASDLPFEPDPPADVPFPAANDSDIPFPDDEPPPEE